MTQQGVNLGRPAPEGYKRLQSGPASAPGQYFVPEPGPGGRRKHSAFLEQIISVSRQHYRPFVAVIPCRVAPGEHVAEGVGEAAIVGRPWNHRDFAADGVDQLLGRRSRPVEMVMKLHVEQGELE